MGRLRSGQTSKIAIPRHREVVATFQRRHKADVDAAVDAASAPMPSGGPRSRSSSRRNGLRAAEILIERKEDHARDMTREMGKVIKETRGDVQEAIDAAYLHNSGKGAAALTDVRTHSPTNSPMAVRQAIASAA